MRNSPPASLSSYTPPPPKTLKRFPECSEQPFLLVAHRGKCPCCARQALRIEIPHAPLCSNCQLERQGGTGKRWANDLDIIAILSYLMLSSSISRISCYLKASCFRPKPLQKHQQPPVGKKVFFTIPPTEVIKNQTKFDQNQSLEKHIQKIPQISIF